MAAQPNRPKRIRQDDHAGGWAAELERAPSGTGRVKIVHADGTEGEARVRSGAEFMREQERRATVRPTARHARLAERVLETRDRARAYTPTGLHDEPARALRWALRQSAEARDAFLKRAVQWGAREKDARAALTALLAAADADRTGAVNRAAYWLARLDGDAERNP